MMFHAALCSKGETILYRCSQASKFKHVWASGLSWIQTVVPIPPHHRLELVRRSRASKVSVSSSHSVPPQRRCRWRSGNLGKLGPRRPEPPKGARCASSAGTRTHSDVVELFRAQRGCARWRWRVKVTGFEAPHTVQNCWVDFLNHRKSRFSYLKTLGHI